ncbi:MAG: mazG [Frankiales bacterium]|nr:mazG [Frankiales bacterium]
MAGRVVVVACSPRIPPGLLSWPAWQALRSGPVLTADGAHPQVPYLRDAGVDVTVVAPSADDLLARADGGDTVVWLSAGTADADLVRALGTAATRGGPQVEFVQASYDPPGARLLDVVAVMDRLRSPGGCPWDARQTHTSLMPYLVEEAYEAYQALEDGDLVDLREELGDVLLQVVFHARLAQEADEPWSVDDVAGDLVDKLVRRHPHVFAGSSPDDLEGSWEALKQAEKGRTSVTDGVPLSQPALLLAAKLQKRAARLGVPADAPDGHGGALWELVARCRAEGVDPEAALRTTARGFRDRLAALEGALLDEGRDPADLTPDEWSTRWTSSAP